METPEKKDCGSVKRKSADKDGLRLINFGVGDRTPPPGFSLWGKNTVVNREPKKLKLEQGAKSDGEVLPIEYSLQDLLRDERKIIPFDLMVLYQKEVIKMPPKTGNYWKYRCVDKLGLEVSVVVNDDAFKKQFGDILKDGNVFHLENYYTTKTPTYLMDVEPSCISIGLGKGSRIAESTVKFDAPALMYCPIDDVSKSMKGKRINVIGVVGHKVKVPSVYSDQITLFLTDSETSSLRVIMFRSDVEFFSGEPGDVLAIMHGLVQEYSNEVEIKVEATSTYLVLNPSIPRTEELKLWFAGIQNAKLEENEDIASQFSNVSVSQDSGKDTGHEEEQEPKPENENEFL